MNRVVTVSLTVNAYALLLKLYPVRFRHVFGDEMTGVFAAALNDARRCGRSAALALFAREMLLTPVAAAQQHLRHLNLGAPGEGPEIRPLGWIKVFFAIFPGVLTVFPIFEIFHYHRDNPLVLAITCLLPLAMSLLIERRIAWWSLPGLGLLISWGLPLGAQYGESVLYLAIATVVITLIWQTLRRRDDMWPLWAVLGMMGAVMLGAYLLTILVTGILPRQFGDVLFHVYLPFGLALFVVAAGLPFARRFGASAVIASLSAMMWPMFMMLIVDVESLGTLQYALAAIYIVTLLIVLPLWVMRASSRAWRVRGMLVPLLTALIGGAGVTIWYYAWGGGEVNALIVNRVQYVIQSLLGLALALLLYDRIGGRTPAADPTIEATFASRV